MEAATIPDAFEIAIQKHRAGRLADAEAVYRQILSVQPGHAGALHLLGVIAHQSGRHDLAVEWIRRAIVLRPNDPSAHSNLGEALRALGRLDEAIAAFRAALQLAPNFPEAHNNLSNVLRERGRLDEAIAALERALELQPDYADAHYNLGNALREQGQLDAAVASYRRVLELRPDYPDALNNLGAALAAQGELDEAIAAFRGALQVEADPARVQSNLIYTLHFHPGYGGGPISAERRRWNAQFGAPLKPLNLSHANDRRPDRRLRLGYVSPDFREHAVGRNLLPLFQRHDRRDFEIFCYSGVGNPDQITDEFRRRADHWRSAVGVGDEALAALIRGDGVDILVDLTQHMAGNRLPMFARQPAPVQVSFAGYPESTGLEAIEYRISDRYLESGFSEDSASSRERLWLIDSFWCYDPREIGVEINGPPASKTGSITFGCLHNFRKINEKTLRLWAQALGRVADSRLVLLSRMGSHRRRVVEFLQREGVEASRVEFLEARPQREYLEMYHRLDIVLDTFPYNGHTTNLDALWMGVPVVSLAGEPPVSRAGLSQLTNLGLPELAAHSGEDYVRIAVELARDLPRLADLRSTLRGRMETSILMDGSRFTRQLEHAYREMWQAWCHEQRP